METVETFIHNLTALISSIMHSNYNYRSRHAGIISVFQEESIKTGEV